MSKQRALDAISLKKTDRIPLWDWPDSPPLAQRLFDYNVWEDTYRTGLDLWSWSGLDITPNISGDPVEWNFPLVRYYDEVEILDDPECLPYIDICVANAVATDMNIIINYHSLEEQGSHGKGKNLDFAKCNEYWDTLAPRYADNDLVYYEITNEPTFSAKIYKNTTFVTNYLALYNKIRTLAPNRQILAFSFNSMDFDYEDIISYYADSVDWDYTTIAYHVYGNTNHTQKVQALMQNYRVMCTEWDYPGTYSYVPEYVDGYWLIAEALENINSGWIDWRDWGDVTLDEINDILIPDAMAKGYWWGPGGNTPPTVSITNPADNDSFDSPATITITANAADADGSVTKVEFFANGSYLGEDTSAPYSYTWSGVGDGSYELTAIATDDVLVTTVSAPVEIIVGNAAPTEIVNPGYETGDLSGWTIDGTAAASSDAHTGSHACAVTDKYSKIYQIVNVNPNTTYTLSAWCKKLDSRSGCSIGVENYGGALVKTDSWNSSWEKISLTFTTGSTNTTAQIFMSPERKNQTHLVDDWELVVGN